ncbi:MAG TPA: site-specific integrase [Terriglobales bacterium]|nr:site-specific integrase [Terriglobales bacterium]
MPRGKTKPRDGIYTRKDRPGEFWASWKDASGRRRRRRLKGVYTLEQARSLLNGEVLRAERSRVLGFVEPSKETFSQIELRYLGHQETHITPAAYARVEGIVHGPLHRTFGMMKLADIRRRDVEVYVDKRLIEVSAGSVLKELNTMKHLLRLAVAWEIVPFNVAAGIKGPKAPAGRVRYLQPGEVLAVLAACPQWLRPIAALAFCTGMRRGEILNLRWLDFDRNGEHLYLPQTKNGEGRTVHLNNLALRALQSLPTANTKPIDRIFKDIAPEQVSMAFLRACKAVGVSDFRFHDCRHTAASWMRMSGADIQDVAEVLGHKDLRMTKRYAHLSPQHLKETMRRLDGVYGELPESVQFGAEVPALASP